MSQTTTTTTVNGGSHLTLGSSSANVSNGTHTNTHSTNLSKNPLERVWRGDKEGKVRMEGVPKFDNPYDEREWIKAHMAAAFRYWGKLGFNEGTAGHITCRDPVLPDHYWMNPFAMHFSLIKKSDLVLVDPEGNVSKHGAQKPINQAGFVIHHTLHKRRPDVVAAAHSHGLHGKNVCAPPERLVATNGDVSSCRAWSVFGRKIDILQQDSCLFYDNLSVYKNYGGIVLSHEEGENIADALGPKNKACIMQNHGLLTLGQTIDECVYLFGLLDKQCHMQLMVEAAAAAGIPKQIIDDEDAAYTAETNGYWETMYLNFAPEYDLLLEETKGAFLA